MQIFELASSGITAADGGDINRLLDQLTNAPKRFSYRDLKRFIKQKKIYVCVVMNGPRNKIIGMATLKIDDSLMFTQYFKKGYIGDVVVDENNRGRGIAKALMLYLINLAKDRRLAHISLTSNPNNPRRTAAIKMYESLGFKVIGQLSGSDYYRLYL